MSLPEISARLLMSLPKVANVNLNMGFTWLTWVSKGGYVPYLGEKIFGHHAKSNIECTGHQRSWLKHSVVLFLPSCPNWGHLLSSDRLVWLTSSPLPILVFRKCQDISKCPEYSLSTCSFEQDFDVEMGDFLIRRGTYNNNNAPI